MKFEEILPRGFRGVVQGVNGGMDGEMDDGRGVIAIAHPSLRLRLPNKGSIFPQAIRDWNTLPDSIIFFAEGAEDGVAAGDLFTISQVLVNECYGMYHQ